MARLVLTVVGGVIGGYYGGSAGAQVGMALGGAIGGTFEPNIKNDGPRLGDLEVSGSSYGAAIPYTQGSPRISGQVIWASKKREIGNTERQGKGGGGGVENTNFTYEIDLLILLTDNEIPGISRVWRNGELVYNGTAKQGLWTRFTAYKGDAAQLPDPTYEAAVGLTNAPAYRGRGSVFIEGLQLGGSGQVPNLTFEIGISSGRTMIFNAPMLASSADDVIAPSIPITYTPSLVAFDPLGGVSFIYENSSTGNMYVYTGSDANRKLDVGLIGNAGLYTFESLIDFDIYPSPSNGDQIKFFMVGIFFEAGFSYLSYAGEFNLIAYASGFSSPVPLGRPPESGLYQIIIDTRDADSTQWTLSWVLNGEVLLVNTVSGSSMPARRIHLGMANGKTGKVNGIKAHYLRVYKEDSGGISYANPTVQESVDSLCTLSGLSPSQYNTSELASITRPVRALAVGRVSNVRNTLGILGSAYQFEAVLSDKIYFRKRAGASVTTIPFADLGCDGGEPFALRLSNELELPAQMAITYSNVSNDYLTDTQYSDRLLTGQESTSAVQLPLGLNSSEAKALADGLLTDSSIAMTTARIAVGQKYAKHEPCDVITVEDEDSNAWRMRIIKKSTTDGLIKFDMVMDDASAFSQSGTTSADSTGQTTVAQPVPITFQLLDIPLLRDADNQPGFYIAVSGGSAAIFESSDNIAFTQITTVSNSAVLGNCTTALPNWTGGNVVDESSTVSVNVGTQQLTSVTRDAMLEDQTVNTVLIGLEILQYELATLVSPGVYTLSGFKRGMRDTASTGHAASERFVFLSGGGVKFIPQQASDIGKTKYYKAVGAGQILSSVASKSLAFTSVNLKPFAPYNLRTSSTSTAVEVTWSRKTRLSESWLDGLIPLGETSESYDVELYNGASLVTSATVTAPSWSTAIAVTGNTVKVYQVSSIVGRGAMASIVVAADSTAIVPTPSASAVFTLAGTPSTGLSVAFYVPPNPIATYVISGGATLSSTATAIAALLTTAGWPSSSVGAAITVVAPVGSGLGESAAYQLASMSAKVFSSSQMLLSTTQTGVAVSAGSSAVWECYLSNALYPESEEIRAGNFYSINVYRSNQINLIAAAIYAVSNPPPASRYEALLNIRSAVLAEPTLSALGYTFTVQQYPSGGYYGLFVAPVGETDVYAFAAVGSGAYPEAFNSRQVGQPSPIVTTARPHIASISITGTVATGEVFKVVIDGVGTFTYTAIGGSTPTSVATALAATLDASPSFSATSSGGTITLTASTAGTAYAIAASIVTALTITKT